jgi:hypothetical protein
VRALLRNAELPLDQASGWPDKTKEELSSKEAELSRNKDGWARDPIP